MIASPTNGTHTRPGTQTRVGPRGFAAMSRAALKALLSPLTGARDSAQAEPCDERQQTFPLARGGRVEVLNISGSVVIETTESEVAEIEVVRRARRAVDLKYHQVMIEQTPDGLLIRGLEDRAAYRRGRQVQQHVRLKLPRAVTVSIKGVGGPVSIGELDGPLQVERVAGTLEVGGIAESLTAANIGGRLRAGILSLGPRGLHLSNVGGPVELHVRGELNADLEVRGLSGRLRSDVPNLTMLAPENAVQTRARFGAGGCQISIRQVNGDVRITQSL
ncbi:MAG: hypothetical protein DMF64_17370 [Acidobacteria bacterium]|nr:MAG: hypothetical protein DMF64_17370 [Acidobacteriota bacterium]